MPRKPRLFVSGATYHVYSRVARGEFAFHDPYEAEEFVETVRHVGDLHNWRVLAWCLMGNHYHLVVKTGTIPLWRSMQRLQSIVAREFNRRRRYLGRLWQSRYRARIIDSNDYLRQVVSYVHLNPVAACIVEDPVDYRYSGHRELMGFCKPLVVDRCATLAISRYGYRVCDVADLIFKHRSSITLWFNKGLFTENTNPDFALRLNQLDEQISRMR